MISLSLVLLFRVHVSIKRNIKIGNKILEIVESKFWFDARNFLEAIKKSFIFYVLQLNIVHDFL